MEWKLVSKHLLVHSNGHKIELKNGSWQAPMEIHPKIIKGTPIVESAKLIREGIEFACRNSVPKTVSIYRRRLQTS